MAAQPQTPPSAEVNRLLSLEVPAAHASVTQDNFGSSPTNITLGITLVGPVPVRRRPAAPLYTRPGIRPPGKPTSRAGSRLGETARTHRGARSGAHRSSGLRGPVDIADPGGQGCTRTTPRPWPTRLCDERTVVAACCKTVSNRSEQESAALSRPRPWFPRSWCSAETQPLRVGALARLVVPTGPAAEQFAGLLRGAGATVDCDRLHHGGLAPATGQRAGGI